MTGKPVPGADISFKEMNGSRPATQADSQGRFTAVTEDRDLNPYYLYARSPSVGKLLGMTFYRMVPARRRGERHSGIVLPTVAATEISGHVYDAGAKPLSGCDVTAFTKDPEMEFADAMTTDKTGAFSFTRLGANRFVLAAECRNYLSGESRYSYPLPGHPWPSRNSWLTAMLPAPVVVLPGERRRGLAFHLLSAPHYSLQGKVVFRDGEKPAPGEAYFYDVSIVPPVALEDSRVQSGNCTWNAASGAFQCNFLPAGSYKLRFSLGQGDHAEFVVKVPRPELTLQPKKWELKLFHNIQPPAPVTGYLHLRFACSDELKTDLVRIGSWGPSNLMAMPVAHKCSEDATWPAEVVQYVMTAYQAGWFGGWGQTLKDWEHQRGTSFTITKGRTTDVTLRPVSTGEVIQMALSALRNER